VSEATTNGFEDVVWVQLSSENLSVNRDHGKEMKTLLIKFLKVFSEDAIVILIIGFNSLCVKALFKTVVDF